MSHQSQAESLRVIGQALETLRISAFALKKEGDKFIVRDWEPSFLKNIAGEVWGGDSGQTAFTNANSSDLLVYNDSDTQRLETKARARRGSEDIKDNFKISSGLRVVGHYLDTQGAVAFNIWWSPESVTVKYKTSSGIPKETNFTAQNLQDLGVGMHLRRSSRHM